MAWGYERSFTIEHDNTLRKRINCKDCIYYESSDKSCLKRPLYLPVDGYNSWRNCKYFALTKGVSNYKEKKEQYFNELLRKDRQEKKNITSGKTVQSKLEQKKSVPTKKKPEILFQEKKIRDGYVLCVVEKYPKDKNIKTEYVAIIKPSGARKNIMIGRDIKEKKIYVSKKTYSVSMINQLYQTLNAIGTRRA